MKSIKVLTALLLVGCIALHSCKKSETSGTMYSVRMTDAPAPYSKVNVDIQGVEVIGTSGTAMLSTHAGIYNLLDFSNGIDTLIASGMINVGTVTQVRFILGPNNSVVQNGMTTAISMASGADAGLTLNINQSAHTASASSLLIDFDANQSVIAQGSGSFSFRPVMRSIDAGAAASATGTGTTNITIGTTTVTTSGTTTGTITTCTSTSAGGTITGHLSSALLASVTATGSSGSFSTNAAADGSFMIQSLAAGSYSLTLTPTFPLQPVTLTNVTVGSGSTTNVGLITF